MEKVMIHTKEAPEATGHYAQAVLAGGFIFTSGQLGLVPETGEMLEGIEAQTKQALANTENVLKKAEMSRSDIVKVNIFVKNLDDFPVVDAVYAAFFQDHRPARCSVQAAKLYPGSLIEIEVIGAK
ncbi:Rid family detoxifying hydrolase [Eubacterium sp. 1001713B170207_170306_E7]|uniref:RidA family protein n=1 Tax=Eubacterium sp. 1001713B170207_170306_E7 TaxID=2787097 RepID=UPI001898B205|nr:Rid family detoxifying hydrolase [Eubacterium sp. 1001713B170207_170306_E7]